MDESIKWSGFHVSNAIQINSIQLRLVGVAEVDNDASAAAASVVSSGE